MRKPSRILVFSLSLVGGLYLLPVSAGLPAGMSSDYEYSIFRNDREIGRHIVRFEETSDGIKVDIEAQIRIKVAFITVFRLNHNASELWQGGQLVTMSALTKRNSKKAHVEVTARPGHLEVKTDKDVTSAPLDSVPTSFTKTNLWETVGDRPLVLLDTLTGQQQPSDFRAGGLVGLDLDGRTVDARYYSITRRDTGALTHEFWVDEAGNMMQTHLMTKDDQSIYYRFSGI